MSIKKPIFYSYDLCKKTAVDLLAIIHVDDRNTEVLEVAVTQGGEAVSMTGKTVIARFVSAKDHILFSDNVACSVNEAGNILVPFDNAVIQSRKCDLKIEVKIADGTDVLTLQFPLWVRVNGSILDTAEISPESQGTIPELLRSVREELRRVGEYVDENALFDAIDTAFTGGGTLVPSIAIDNDNQSGDYILYYVDGDFVRHDIFNFSQYFITEPYNLYDPCAAYTVTDASQTGKVGYSVDSGTGNITVTRAQGDGQKYIRYADKTLKAGTYTLSGKVTLHSNAADGNRTMCCNVGYEKTRQQVNLTTERGGSQNIGSSDKEGWFSCTVTLSYDQVFSFEAIPWSTTVCNSNLPAVLSNVQIIEGADIGAYSPAARTSVDIKARTLIGKRGADIAANTTALKNRNGVIYTTASARHKFELLNNSGLKVTIGAGLNTKLAGDHAGLNWDTISTAMPSGSFSTATGDKAIITMSSQTALVYNTSDGKLHLRDVSVSTESNFYPDDILLVLNGAGTPLKGLIFDEYIRRSAEDRAIDNDFAVTIPVVANGTVSVVNGVTEYSYNATRIRTNWIYFSAGDTITINSGSLRHAIQIWHGKTRTSANVPSSYRSRNIGAYTAATESLTFDYDGTMVVIFTNANNSALSVDDFDGSIKHYRFASRRTQEMLDTALNGINFSIVSKASPLYYNVFNGYFYKGQPITISYSRTDSAASSLQPHFIKKDGTSFAPASPYHQIAPNTTVTFTLSDDAVMMYTYCSNGENCSATITAPPLSKFLGDKINELSQTYTDIVTLNKDALARLDEAKTFVKRRGRTDTYTPTFALLHFSDIHGATTALTRLVELKNHLGSKLSDTICTGDMVNDKYEDTMSFWDGVTGAGSILTCIGNHDVHHQGESSYTADQIGQTDTYTRYFAPYKDGWGVTIGENLTYYYKDYPTNKVRLIALNYLLTGDEATAQNTWLQARLAEAKTNGYTVIIAAHCQLQNSNAVDCSFTTFGKTTFGGQLDESYQASVQSFINDGGLFACYISGHTHWDAVAYNSNYPNQLCITVTTASVNMNDNDQPRISGTITQDAANLIVIDVDFKVVKIIRVGANIDTYLRGRNTLTYSYDTHSVLSELPTTQGVLYGNTSN